MCSLPWPSRQRPKNRAHQWIERQSYRIAQHEAPLAHAFGARGYDIRFVELVEQIGTHDPGEPRRAGDAEHHCREPDVLREIDHAVEGPRRVDIFRRKEAGDTD